MEYYQRSPADVPAGLTAAEWALVYGYNCSRFRQDLLEFAFALDPFKLAALTVLWWLGCPLAVVVALVLCFLVIHTLLCWSDEQRLARVKAVTAKLDTPNAQEHAVTEETPSNLNLVTCAPAAEDTPSSLNLLPAGFAQATVECGVP